MNKHLSALVQEMVDKGVAMDQAIQEFERQFIRKVIRKHRGNKTRAAEELGFHRNTLNYKIRRLQIDNGDR